MSRPTTYRAHRLPRPLRMAVTTVVLGPLLLPAALLSLGIMGLGSLLEPVIDFEAVEAVESEDLWPELPATGDPALPQEFAQSLA